LSTSKPTLTALGLKKGLGNEWAQIPQSQYIGFLMYIIINFYIVHSPTNALFIKLGKV
jgi:hypothetical protein